MELTINKNLFGQIDEVGIRKWANAGLLCEILKTLSVKGILKPGQAIETRDLAQLIKDNGLDKNWKLRSSAKDTHGLTRSIGDTIGGHGLGLKKISARRYMMPDKLPEMLGDSILKEAFYPECKDSSEITTGFGINYKEEIKRITDEVANSYYKINVTYMGGLYRTYVKFGDTFYRNITSDSDAVLNILNPMAYNPTEETTLKKDEIRKILMKLKFDPSEGQKGHTFFCKPAIYQKLYGAHSPGRTVFQLVGDAK